MIWNAPINQILMHPNNFTQRCDFTFYVACLCKLVFFVGTLNQTNAELTGREEAQTDMCLVCVTIPSSRLCVCVCMHTCTLCGTEPPPPPPTHPTQPTTLLHWEGFPRKLSPLARSGEGEPPLACILKFRPLKHTTWHPER